MNSFKRLSLFDLDHTLLRVNCSFSFGLYLYRQKLFNSLTLLSLLSCYWRHKRWGMSVADLHDKIFRRLFFGKELALFQEHADAFVEQQFAGLIYQPAYQRLKERQADGAYTAILSTSPDFLVQRFAKAFGVNDWKATVYGVDKHRRLCKISQLVQGQDKALIASALAMELGIEQPAIEAYSDSCLDLPFLEGAGHAVGVNPERKLLCICRQRNWEVL